MGIHAKKMPANAEMKALTENPDRSCHGLVPGFAVG